MTIRIVVARDLGLSRHRAFTAWTTADALAAWWWPHLPETDYEVDARPGGSYRIRCDAVGIGVHGEYTVVEPPTRLEFTWVWEGEHPPEPVIVTIEGDDDRARVTVTHVCGQDAAAVTDLTQGWNDVLDRLAALR